MAEKSLVNDPALTDAEEPDVVAVPPPDVVAEDLDLDELPQATSPMAATMAVDIAPTRLTEMDIFLPLDDLASGLTRWAGKPARPAFTVGTAT
jgi:hypothetical protein